MAETLTFSPARRRQVFARVALIGPSGSGKSYSALRLAKGMGDRVAMINTEGDRGQLYAGQFDYDLLNLAPPFEPERFVQAINVACLAGYDVVIVDSASHEWNGAGGILEIKDRMPGANSFTAWKTLTPRHNAFLAALTASPVHVIACLRGKDQYVIEDNSRGKAAPKKVGVGPEQRAGIEYEFMLSLLIDQHNHAATSSKDNTSLFPETFCEVLTEAHGTALRQWSESGEAAPAPEPPQVVSFPIDICPIGTTKGRAWAELSNDLLAKAHNYAKTREPDASPELTKDHVAALEAVILSRQEQEQPEAPTEEDSPDA